MRKVREGVYESDAPMRTVDDERLKEIFTRPVKETILLQEIVKALKAYVVEEAEFTVDTAHEFIKKAEKLNIQ